MMKTAARAILYPLLLSVSIIATRADDESGSGRIVDLLLTSGDRQRALYLSPSSPRATIVMLSGGSGEVGITRDGDLRHDRNFVVRTRDLWVAKGYAVLIPDWIGRESLRGARSSPDYAAVVEDLVHSAQAQS